MKKSYCNGSTLIIRLGESDSRMLNQIIPEGWTKSNTVRELIRKEFINKQKA